MEHLRKYPHSLLVKFLGTHITQRHTCTHRKTLYLADLNKAEGEHVMFQNKKNSINIYLKVYFTKD